MRICIKAMQNHLEVTGPALRLDLQLCAMTRLATRFAVLLRPVLAGLALVTGISTAAALEIRTGPSAVIELFTSQGCSSCPPADALLTQLGTRGDVVALAYHVDYWDYIGWEDTFALPGNGQLQRAYAQAWGKGRIYTPQMVINGQRGIAGTYSSEIRALVRSTTLPLDLQVREFNDGTLTLSMEGSPRHQDAVVWLVTFKGSAEVTIDRGENSGHTMAYSHIVTSRQAIGMWTSSDGLDMRIPLEEALGPENDGAAILVQEKHGELPGPILGAVAITRN